MDLSNLIPGGQGTVIEITISGTFILACLAIWVIWRRRDRRPPEP